MMVRNQVAYKPPRNKILPSVCVSVECRAAQINHNIPDPSLMLAKHCAPGLFSRFAVRHYATRQRQPAAKGKAYAPAPKSMAEKATLTDSTGTSTTNKPSSEDELVEKVEMIRAMSRLHPTLDPWGQRVDTLGALPRSGILALTHPHFHKKRRYITLSCVVCHPVTFPKYSCHSRPVSQKPSERRQECYVVSQGIDINTSFQFNYS